MNIYIYIYSFESGRINRPKNIAKSHIPIIRHLIYIYIYIYRINIQGTEILRLLVAKIIMEVIHE